jgi:methionyl-tRNA formyltransferase
MGVGMKIVIVGEESAGVQALRSVVSAGHEIPAVLTSDYATGAAGPVKALAAKLGVLTLQAARVRDDELAKWIRREDVDLILNVHSLHIVHPAVVSAPKIGSFNLHPGPLPRYAGLNAPSWAIYQGEQEHGVTVHWMDTRVDTGPIAYQTRFEIRPEDTGLSLSLRCIRAGVALVEKLVAVASESPAEIPSVPQDLSQRTYFDRGVPNHGRMQWAEPARRIVDFVRAADYSPFPSPWGVPWSTLDGDLVRIGKVARTGIAADAKPGTVGETSDDGVAVAAIDEWVLVGRITSGKPSQPLRRGRRLV